MSPMAENSKIQGKKWTFARRIVQIAILLLFLSPLLLAGWAIAGTDLVVSGSDNTVPTPAQQLFYGTLSSSNVGPITLLDPFAVLQTIAASKTFDIAWLIGLLPVLLVFALIRGRAFCGWVCPVNLVLEAVDFLRKKIRPNQKLPEQVLPRRTKVYVAAAVLVLSAVLSVPVFEVLSPISFINKGLVFGSLVGGITFVAIILVEVGWGHRVWCRSICPLGGFYQVVGKIGFMNVHINHETCINCKSCRKACLCDPEVLEPAIEGSASAVCAGDCMLCGKCVDACPTGSLSIGVGRGK